MLTRTQVFNALEKMPEQFSIDLLFDRLLFINQVENGLAQSENGQVLSKEEAKQKLSQWFITVHPSARLLKDIDEKN